MDRSASIERLAGEIQRLPASVRWLHAQPDVILALACEKPLVRGPRMCWVDRFVRLTTSLGIARVSATAVSLVTILATYIRQLAMLRRPQAAHAPFFVGMGALREPGLVRQLEELTGRPVDSLNLFDFRTFFRRRHVGAALLLKEWLCVWREISSELAPAAVGGVARGLPLDYRLSQVLTRSHCYIYARAWFRAQVQANPQNNTIGFSTADDLAYAAVAAGAKAIYLVHGFLARSLIFPDFAEVHCFTSSEREHFQDRLPQAKIHLVPPTFRPIVSRRVLAIAGGYLAFQQVYPCDSLLSWAQKTNLPIIVRVHPNDHSGYWERFRGQPGIEVEQSSTTFSTFLAQHRPRILATWMSTAIFDSLTHGVVPLTLLADSIHTADVVFPIRHMALVWPEDRDTLDLLLDAPDSAVEFAAEAFRKTIDDVPDVIATSDR